MIAAEETILEPNWSVDTCHAMRVPHFVRINPLIFMPPCHSAMIWMTRHVPIWSYFPLLLLGR